MEKNQNINSENLNEEIKEAETEEQIQLEQEDSLEKNQEVKEISLEEKIKELEDKVVRTLAEMENQRRRFEKEKDDAFDYGGFTFAKEALNLIDNLERSKLILESDEALKGTEALKKTLEHLDIINNWTKNLNQTIKVKKSAKTEKYQLFTDIK